MFVCGAAAALTILNNKYVHISIYYISFLSGGICSEPADILNGRHSVLGGTQQQLHYQCDPGFLLWGASDLVCLANNTYVNAIILIYCVLTVYIDKEWTCTILLWWATPYLSVLVSGEGDVRFLAAIASTEIIE